MKQYEPCIKMMIIKIIIIIIIIIIILLLLLLLLYYNNNNKMEKIQNGEERASGGESVGEQGFILFFSFSSLLSHIYENRTSGFRRD